MKRENASGRHVLTSLSMEFETSLFINVVKLAP
jgi:hypothetical protein